MLHYGAMYVHVISQVHITAVQIRHIYVHASALRVIRIYVLCVYTDLARSGHGQRLTCCCQATRLIALRERNRINTYRAFKYTT